MPIRRDADASADPRGAGEQRTAAEAELLAESLPASQAVAPSPADPLLHQSETYVKAVAEAMATLARDGFTEPFDIGDDDVVRCVSCRSRLGPDDVNWMRHIEVAPADGEHGQVVCGLRCPICGARGAATASTEQWERRARRPRGPR